jgi:hypothetical protein
MSILEMVENVRQHSIWGIVLRAGIGVIGIIIVVAGVVIGQIFLPNHSPHNDTSDTLPGPNGGIAQEVSPGTLSPLQMLRK